MLKIILVLMMALIPLTASAVSSIPYKVLNTFRAAAMRANTVHGLHYTSIRVLLKSTRHGVTPDQIILTIHSKQGAITLSPKRDGILVIPANRALEAENPNVSTNQPKGTLTLAFQPVVETPVPNHFSLSLANAMVHDYMRARSISPLFARLYRLKPRYFKLVGNNIAVSTTCGIAFSRVSGGMKVKIEQFPKGCTVSTTGHVTRAKLQFAK